MNSIRKTLLAVGLALLSSLIPAPAFAKLNLIVEIVPAGALFSSGTQGFTVTKGGSSDRIASPVSFAPLERIGVGIPMSSGSLDLTVGAGMVLNDALLGSLYTGDAAWRFKVGKKTTLAPRIGVVGFMSRWLGLGHTESRDVSIENGVGVLSGLAFTFGKKIAFRASADYLYMSPRKVTTANGWTADRSTIDISGFLLQVGVVARFFTGAPKS